jgi:hypothetical protein
VEGDSKYMDLSLIVGSAAIVKSMWSELDNMFSNKRRSCLSPLNGEMLLFLKKNKDLWSIGDVHLANNLHLKALRYTGDDKDDDIEIVSKRIKEPELWEKWMEEKDD